MKLLSLLLFLFIVDIPLCHAYLISTGSGSSATECEFIDREVVQQIYVSSLTIDASQLINLSGEQYYYISSSGTAGFGNDAYSFVTNCDNWDAKVQRKTKKILTVVSPNAYATIKESGVVNLPIPKADDLNDGLDIFTTNIPGLFYFFRQYSSNKQNLPIEYDDNKTFSNKISEPPFVFIKFVANKDFRGIPEGTDVYATTPYARIEMHDANESAGGHTVFFGANIHALSSSNVKMTSVCNYSLSNNGVVDFGDQNLSKVTNSRVTTLKKPLTLYMKDCYGVNKVKTYISNAANTLEGGMLLGNAQTINAATNVAIGINVSPDTDKNSENTGVAMFMDGTHPLEWNFGNKYTIDAISKEIPLEVFLLKSGGEPTTGDFKATATIMMDFI